MRAAGALRGLAEAHAEREHSGRGDDEDIVHVRFARDKRVPVAWFRGIPHLGSFLST